MSTEQTNSNDIRNIRPNGKAPDKIYRIVDGEAVEIKKAYRIINGEAVVVWDVGNEPPVPPVSAITIIDVWYTAYGGQLTSVSIYHPEQYNITGHTGTIDWGDGTVDDFDSHGSKGHTYDTVNGLYQITIDCPMEMVKPTLKGTAVQTWVFYKNKYRYIKFADTVHTIGSYVFNTCDFVSDTAEPVVIDFNKAEKIESSVFYDCLYWCTSNIKIIADNAKDILGKIDGSTSVRSVRRITELSIRNAENIGPSAFIGAPITELILEKVKTIGNYAFSGNKLTEIEFPNTIESIGSGAFNSSTLTTIKIHKPANSISGAPWGATKANVIWLG